MAGGGAVVAVGRITRAHGVKGEVAVLPLTQVDERFAPGSRLTVEGGDDALTVVASRPHRGRLLVTFEGVKDRDRAETLRGAYLVVPVSEVPPLPEGEYWPHELVGCEVRTETGTPLGTIREVLHTEANDVWVARTEDGETLIPALKDVVASVDVAGGMVVVREIPGLTTA
jgi:16S rRNA processing protein RimM